MQSDDPKQMYAIEVKNDLVHSHNELNTPQNSTNIIYISAWTPTTARNYIPKMSEKKKAKVSDDP